MKCPKCNTELVANKYSCYEDLIDHVLDPNGMPGLKPEFRCTNKCFPKRVFWDMFGDVYIRPPMWQKLLWKLNIFCIHDNLKVPNALN